MLLPRLAVVALRGDRDERTDRDRRVGVESLDRGAVEGLEVPPKLEAPPEPAVPPEG